MNTTTLNIPYLKAINACSGAIKFVKRNKLEGFPLNILDEVSGDYKGYVSWLHRELKTKREFDDRGNKVSATHPDGIEFRWEYDDRGNMIRETNPYGIEMRWETEFYADGQLKRIGELEIPWFEK